MCVHVSANMLQLMITRPLRHVCCQAVMRVPAAADLPEGHPPERIALWPCELCPHLADLAYASSLKSAEWGAVIGKDNGSRLHLRRCTCMLRTHVSRLVFLEEFANIRICLPNTQACFIMAALRCRLCLHRITSTVLSCRLHKIR